METPSPTSLLATLSLLFVLAFGNSFITTTSASAGGTSNEFIKTSCSTTTYPTLCLTSLSSHANTIQTSPKILAHTALSISLDMAHSTSSMMVKLSQTRGLKPREAAAMRDCVEELSDSVDELRHSMSEMTQLVGSTSRQNKDVQMLMSDIQTWVSAALTDDDTCMEGFRGAAMTGKMKNVVRGRIVNVTHLTSNALALINNYASTFHA